MSSSILFLSNWQVILSKGDKPYVFNDLRSALDAVWKLSHPWKLFSLGSGYLNIHVSNAVDRDRIWGMTPPTLKPGIMHLQ